MRKIVAQSAGAPLADRIRFFQTAIAKLREDGRIGLPTNIALKTAAGQTLGSLFRAKFPSDDYGTSLKQAVEAKAIYSTWTRGIGLISDRPFVRPDAKPKTAVSSPASQVLAKLGL